MRHLLLPVFVMLVTPWPAQAQKLEDFNNLSRAIGKEISVVDQSGLIREGILETAAADGVRLRVGSASQWFPRGEIASAERLKDESSDGAIKGAIWALALALMPNQGCTSFGHCLRGVATAFVVLPAAGYLLDAARSNRQPLYRSPMSPPTLKLFWRF